MWHRRDFFASDASRPHAEFVRTLGTVDLAALIALLRALGSRRLMATASRVMHKKS